MKNRSISFLAFAAFLLIFMSSCSRDVASSASPSTNPSVVSSKANTGVSSNANAGVSKSDQETKELLESKGSLNADEQQKLDYIDGKISDNDIKQQNPPAPKTETAPQPEAPAFVIDQQLVQAFCDCIKSNMGSGDLRAAYDICKGQMEGANHWNNAGRLDACN